MRHLSLSDFEWFKKKSQICFGDDYFRCGGITKKDRKIIFPLKHSDRHLTFSTSSNRIDLHSDANHGEKNYRSILQISVRKTKKLIKKQKNHILHHTEFFPYNSKYLKKLVFVNPWSKEFLMEGSYLRNNLDLHPSKLLKLKIKNMKRLHGKILFAYDLVGRFKGIVKCNHRKAGFENVTDVPLNDIFSSILNVEHVKNSLIKEGLKYNPKHEQQWKIWLCFVRKIELIKAHMHILLRIFKPV